MTFHGYKPKLKFSNIFNSQIKWRNTANNISGGNGLFFVGVKNEKEYYIKRNKNIKLPVNLSSLNNGEKEKLKKQAETLERKQKRIRELLGDLSFEKDHIAVEEEHFWERFEQEFNFVTVTRYADHATSHFDVFAKQPYEVRHDVILQMAIEVQKIHKRGVIHADIKTNNFLYKKVGGRYYAYLIDFDSSYPANEVEQITSALGLTCTRLYRSPEFLLASANKYAPFYMKLISDKADVFSLALAFHNVLCPDEIIDSRNMFYVNGSYPEVTKNELDFHFSSDARRIIGQRYKVRYIDLFRRMLSVEPSDRPSMDEVVAILQDKAQLGEKKNSRMIFRFDELWPEHQQIAEYDEHYLRRKFCILRLTRVDDGGHKYQVSEFRSSSILTLEQMFKEGYLIAKRV